MLKNVAVFWLVVGLVLNCGGICGAAPMPSERLGQDAGRPVSEMEAQAILMKSFAARGAQERSLYGTLPERECLILACAPCLMSPIGQIEDVDTKKGLAGAALVIAIVVGVALVMAAASAAGASG